MTENVSLRTKIDVVVLLVVVVSGIGAINNAQSIGDWWHSLWYTPPKIMAKLAKDAGMNARGRAYFYRFSPRFVSSNTMETLCGGRKLGCTEGHSIYILNYHSREEYDRSIVTAAHEMLHVAYSRLAPKQRQIVNYHLARVLNKHSAENIRLLLAGYPRSDRYNEAHSYIGTQMLHIGHWLATYYHNYFSDRVKTVQAFFRSPEGH